MFDKNRFRDFIKKYTNKYIDYDGQYGPQCVDLFREYNAQVLGILSDDQPAGVVGARHFFENFERDPKLMAHFMKIKNTLAFVPREGDVAFWDSKYGPYGHVAIHTDKANQAFFEAFSQNDPPKSTKNPKGTPCILKKYSYFHYYGVLRPREKISTPNEIKNYIGIIKVGESLYGFHK